MKDNARQISALLHVARNLLIENVEKAPRGKRRRWLKAMEARVGDALYDLARGD